MYNIPEHWKVAGRIVHNDVLYCHGISPITHKATLAFNKNVIQGHYHAMLGINYITTPVKKMFSGYTGGCCNDKAIAMRYAKDNLNKSAYGVIVIINKIPQVVPL